MEQNCFFTKRAKDNNFWKEVRENPKYYILIEELLRNYDVYCRNEIPELPYSLFQMFWKNGNRTQYEERYFARRQRLNTTALLSLIYPENEEYFSNLQDTIWAVCNECTWVLPAHLGFSSETGCYDEITFESYNNIDLFSAETGFALSEIKFLLQDRFDKMILERIEESVARRIIHPFLEKSWYWERWVENWSAVCAGSVGCVFLYERPDLFPQIKERIDDAMTTFLSSYKEEGICEEGVMYWEYGFGFFVAYAELARELTNYENWLELPHVKTIAEYSNMIFLGDKLPITFGDSTLIKNPVSMGLMGFLRQYYGETIPIFDMENYGISEYCARWQRHIRSFVYFDTECDYRNIAKNETFFKPGAGLFLRKGATYDLAVTAGNNDMPHNHNDLGSFIVRYGNERIIDDVGAGEYTMDYFDVDKRYTHFVCRSGGHSVPIINGKEQPFGKEYKAKMQYDGNLSVDLTNAYQDEQLRKLIRSFFCYDNKIVLKDEFDLDGTFKERFVTRLEPNVEQGKLTIGGATIIFDNAIWKVSISKETYRKHNLEEDALVYVIDFETDCKVSEFVMNITF